MQVANSSFGCRRGTRRAPVCITRATQRANANCIFHRRKTRFLFRAEKIPRFRDAPIASFARSVAAPRPPPTGNYFCKTVDIQKSRD